jgi:hypothetical protein
MTKTEAKYTKMHDDDNLFGDQKYITEEMLREFAANDEYEYQQIKDLWDSTDPESRIWQNPIPKDSNSFGVTAGTYEVTNEDNTKSTKNVYMFNNDTTYSGSSAFKNFNAIDKNKTTAHIDTANGQAQIPVNTSTTQNTDCCNMGPWTGMAANEYWYVGYNRTKTYNPTKWKDNLNSSKIPSVCRLQKFKPTITGQLKTLTLNLKGHSDAEYPLIIEIYEYPKKADSKPLASTEYRFTTTSSALVAIDFPAAPTLTKDKEYCFVLRSPLTSFKKAYGIAGWSKTCGKDTYTVGMAELSEDNGYSWIKHGKPEKVKYHTGAKPPVNFGFVAHMEATTSEYPVDTDYTVYFKTQRMNPITYAKISPTQVVDTTNGTSINWYISQDAKTWSPLTETNNYSKTFTTTDNSNSTFLFLKAILRTSNKAYTPSISYVSIHCDTEKANTALFKSQLFKPKLSQMLGASIWSNCFHPYVAEADTNVEVDIFRDIIMRDRFKIINPVDIVNYPFEAEFLQEYFFKDRYNQIHPVDTNDVATAQDITAYEAAQIATVKTETTGKTVTADSIVTEYTTKHYIQLTTDEANSLASLFNDELAKVTTDSTAKDFIINYPSMVLQLYEHNIFLYGTYQLPLSAAAVSPIGYMTYLPVSTDGTANEIALAEYHDYSADYDNSDYFLRYNNLIYDLEENNITILNFLEASATTSDTVTLNSFAKLEVGDYEVEYTPLWIQGLSLDDFAKHDDDGNVVTNSLGNTVYNGFKLDLMVDNIPITWENDILNKIYPLTVEPLCALRKVVLNEDTDAEQELYEDVDFTVDYINKKINFYYTDFNPGDIVTIRYTPNLTDTGLGVAYRMTRTNLNNQAYILPNYWQYRV